MRKALLSEGAEALRPAALTLPSRLNLPWVLLDVLGRQKWIRHLRLRSHFPGPRTLARLCEAPPSDEAISHIKKQPYYLHQNGLILFVLHLYYCKSRLPIP